MSDNDVILKSFQFCIPVELISKSEKPEEDEAVDSWKIRGIASTPDEDLQGEIVQQEGLDISVLRAGRGLFNYDHQKGPENVIGQIDDGEFVRQDGKRVLRVEGYLFKHQPRAQAFYNIMKSVRKGGVSRVHLSIEGKILQRDLQNQNVIKKARIDKVALTLDPVNPNTYVDLLKSLAEPDKAEELSTDNTQLSITFTADEAEKVLKALAKLKKTGESVSPPPDSSSGAPTPISGVNFKSLSAGAGGTVAPTQMTSGECQTKESLDKDTKKVNAVKKKKKMSKSQVELIIDSIRKAFPDQDPVELAEMVCESVLRNLTKESM